MLVVEGCTPKIFIFVLSLLKSPLLITVLLLVALQVNLQYNILLKLISLFAVRNCIRSHVDSPFSFGVQKKVHRTWFLRMNI